MLDLKLLRNFLAVVEHGSISKAAVAVRIAQPALSRQLQMLEAEFGTALLHRYGWGVAPTAEGEVLARHARGLLDQAREVREAVAVAAAAPIWMAIGVPSSLATVLLPEMIETARRELPSVRLRLVEGYSGNLNKRLLAGELDIAIVYDDHRRRGPGSQPLLRERLVAVGGAGRLDAGRPLSLAEFATMPCVMPASANRLRGIIDEASRAAGCIPTVVSEMDSLPALIELLATNDVVSILPYSAVEADCRRGRLSHASLSPENLERTLVLARASERVETPAWRASARLIRELVKRKEALYGWRVED